VHTPGGRNLAILHFELKVELMNFKLELSLMLSCSATLYFTQVLPTQLVPDDEGKILRVRLIQKEGKKLFDPVYLFDEGSTISWIPCGRKLTCSFPGIKFYYGPDTW
jgi:hypothetical protein